MFVELKSFSGSFEIVRRYIFGTAQGVRRKFLARGFLKQPTSALACQVVNACLRNSVRCAYPHYRWRPFFVLILIIQQNCFKSQEKASGDRIQAGHEFESGHPCASDSAVDNKIEYSIPRSWRVE